jgi:hypothetical protein
MILFRWNGAADGDIIFVGWGRLASLPVENRGEVLCNQTFVVRLELDRITEFVPFAVQVVRIERAHCFKAVLILLVHKMRVCTLTMPSGRCEASDVSFSEFQRVELTDRSCDSGSSRVLRGEDCSDL